MATMGAYPIGNHIFPNRYLPARFASAKVYLSTSSVRSKYPGLALFASS